MSAHLQPLSPRRAARWLSCASLAVWLSACGGGGGSASTDAPASATSPTTTTTTTTAPPPAAIVSDPATPKPTSARDANRLAQQASFGPSESMLTNVAANGATAWVAAQLKLSGSHYSTGGDDSIHRWTDKNSGYCDAKPDTCWRDAFSSQPLLWDFYRNAMTQPDQLRQRVAFALQQIVVVSGVEIDGTYGLRAYHNALLDNAFGNYRDVLKKVALSPVMGDYLNSVNNDQAAPNENFARELLQLFSIGTCALAADSSLQGGACTPNYTNETVRNYAYALTGWTYPAGGTSPWGCWPQGTNCRYYGGDMVPVAQYHDSNQRALLSGVTVPSGSSAPQALDAVLDSLMQHPNIAPFISRQLIQHLVSSNPSPAYVARVAAAFTSGTYASFGSGQRGDLAATVAAALLDSEARTDTPAKSAGRLREPALLFTGVLRALNGHTDGDPFGWWWGETLRQHVFRPPSVFNFYPSNYPLPGSSSLQAPEFALHNANSALERLNYLMYVVSWGGSAPDASVPGALGTQISTTAFEADAADAAKLVDRLALLATGQPLPDATRAAVITAVEALTAQTDGNWIVDRVKQAAYLVFGAPDYQVIR